MRTSSSGRPEMARFATTQWSLVVAASGQPDVAASRSALATLCEMYWYPVYAFIRRRGCTPDDAQDLTQGFFAALLEKDFIRSADRERGRFRTFLLTAAARFVSKERERARARKRGGGRKVLSLDLDSAERQYQLEPADNWSPERLYDRRWALTLLDRALARLAERYREQGKEELFKRLKCCLTGGAGDSDPASLAAELQLTEGALKVAVHRLRRRYRDILKQEIAGTLADPEDVPDELEYLTAALRGL